MRHGHNVDEVQVLIRQVLVDHTRGGRDPRTGKNLCKCGATLGDNSKVVAHLALRITKALEAHRWIDPMTDHAESEAIR